MSNILQDIKNECAWVAENNAYISLNAERIRQYAADIPVAEIFEKSTYWDTNWHYVSDNDEDTVAYIVALDSINFGSGYFTHLKRRENISSGYVTVAMALKDRFDVSPMTAADMAALTAQDCADIFGQDMAEPLMADLMEKFAASLVQTGQHITAYYDGSFVSLIHAANRSAADLVDRVRAIPPFHDISVYQGRAIPIFKRAQILVGDLYTAYQGKRFGAFDDISSLTIFADNVVPHVLRYDGVLDYAPQLAARIDAGQDLEQDEEAEIALRACAIHAAECIVAALHEQGHKNISSMNLDHWLWHRGHEPFYMGKKRHHTKTTDY